MPTLIKLEHDGPAIADDQWQLLSADQAAELATTDALMDKTIVPLAYWNANYRSLASRAGNAIWLDSDEPPEEIEGYVGALALIAINFPVFSDGRGYSYATNLRDKLKFTGEIRAIGDVLPDQLAFYRRCGFTSFQLREDKDADAAMRSFDDFSVSYQGASDDPEPLFRKR